MKNIPKIELPEGAGAKLAKAGLIVGAFFVGKKLLANAAKDSADKNLDTDPAAGQARSLNAAMNPSGFSWMRSFDGTNTDAIYDIAGQITDLNKVEDFYKAQTEGRVLFDDLTSEIGADGLQKFLGISSKGKTGEKKYSKVRTDVQANRWVITTSEANIRKTPKKDSKYNPLNNIVRLVAKGKALGISTGKFAYDQPNDTTFIEFYTLNLKTKAKVFFYVAKSQVEYLTTEEKKKRELKTGLTPLEILTGLSGMEDSPSTQVVSNKMTVIYNEQFKELTFAPTNIIIGFPIMTLTTDKGTFIKVQTVQGNIRWVNAKDVRIENRS